MIHSTSHTASNSARWERLHREKAALEVAFERELQELQLQQEAELAAVEEGLRKCHLMEAEHLKAEHRSEMEELRTQQQEQVRERLHGRCVGFIHSFGLIFHVKSGQPLKDISVWVVKLGGGNDGQPSDSHSGAQRHA